MTLPCARLSTKTWHLSSLKANLLSRRIPGTASGSRAAHSSAQPRRTHQPAPNMALAGDVFFLDSFCIRQFDDPNYSGTRISFDKAEFVRRIHEAHKAGAPLVDGYAPFCKHIFVPNFVGSKAGALEITDANRSLLRSGYTKRRPEELAVMTR